MSAEKLFAVTALVALGGCTYTVPYERTVRLVITDDVQSECGWTPFRIQGCAKLSGAHCTIVARRPKSFDDHRRLETLGHELWHCFTGAAHS